MAQDVIVTPTNTVIGALQPSTPIYLIILEDGKSKKKFLTISKIDMQSSYVQAKGIFVEHDEEHISNKYQEILASSLKSNTMEMIFPWTKISSIRNLIFKAK